MKKIIYVILFFQFFTVSPVFARSDFGLGIIVGSPTGLSIKKWLGNNAVDAAAGWSSDAFHLHVDYLFHNSSLTRSNVPIHFGIGGRLKFQDEDKDKRHHDDDDDEGGNRLGLRIPLGINYLFARHPFDIFAEVAPVLDLVPETDLSLDAGVGVRFYFH
jgi:hypothetical protein